MNPTRQRAPAFLSRLQRLWKTNQIISYFHVKPLQRASGDHTHLLEWWVRSKWLRSCQLATHPYLVELSFSLGRFVTQGWHTCLSQYEVQQGKQETVKQSRLLLAKLSEWPRAPGRDWGGYDCCCRSRHFLKKTTASDHTWSPGTKILSPSAPKLMSVAYNPTQNTPLWLLTSWIQHSAHFKCQALTPLLMDGILLALSVQKAGPTPGQTELQHVPKFNSSWHTRITVIPVSTDTTSDTCTNFLSVKRNGAIPSRSASYSHWCYTGFTLTV